MTKIIENILINEFKDKEIFSLDELKVFFRHLEPDIKEGTIAWRIYNLMKKNIIKPVKRGFYVISFKPKYKPEISGELLKIAKLLTTRYEDIKNCIWETSWLNEFSQHQTGKQMIIIEIEKEFVESLFYELKDKFSYEVFLEPDEKTIDLYISESKKPVIIKKLITRSPLAKHSENQTKIYSPLIEKILVDIFAEEKLFHYYKGSELIHIFKNVLEHYTINFTKLFSYAKRREKEQDIKQFMTNHMFHLVKNYLE